MTNTLTSDIESTYNQIVELYNAGSEIVRITVNDDEAAIAVPEIKRKLIENNIFVPIV
jgi:(E)-4-hydroxy-3-methylbut-2-enyl-diphosphate synthase